MYLDFKYIIWKFIIYLLKLISSIFIAKFVVMSQIIIFKRV